MKGKILLVVGLGVGYVLGSKAGRQRYDEIVAKAQQFWNDPRVKSQVNNAQGFVKDKAPEVADFISKNVKKPAADKTSGASTSTTTGSTAPKS